MRSTSKSWRFGKGSVGAPLYIFAGVLLLRLVVLVRLSSSAFLLPGRGDMHFYNDWALRILHGQWTDHHAFYGLPLYPYLLALIYKVFGYSPFVPGLLQACADGGTAVILYKLALGIFAGATDQKSTELSPHVPPFHEKFRAQTIGWLAAIGWAFFKPEQTYSAVLMPAALAAFVFWFVVWQVVKRDEPAGALALFGLGALIGVSAMGVATILFAVPLVLAAIWFKWRKPGGKASPWFPKMAGSATLLAGIAIGVLPCAIHNYVVARDPVILSAHSGVNFWIGNNPVATGYPNFPPGLHAGQEAMLRDSIKIAEEAAGHSIKRSEVSDYWSAKAKDYIRHHPFEWLRLLGTKTGNFWNAFQYDDLSMITALREHRVTFPALGFGLIAAMAIPGLLIVWKRFPLSRWIGAAVLLHMVSLLSVFVTERYRLAAVPGLLLFAGCGLWIFWDTCVTRSVRQAGIYLVLLALATWFVSIPRREPSFWALDSYNSGWQALEANDLATAEQKLGLAYAYVPGNTEINFALGNLRLQQGNRSEAKSYYAATVRLDATHEGAWNNLGVLALEESRWPLAAQFFQRALRKNPDDAKTHYLFAKALLGTGDRQNAKNEIARAVELDPDQAEFKTLKDELAQGSDSPSH